MSKTGHKLRNRLVAGAVIALALAGLVASRASLRPTPAGAFLAVPGCEQNPAALNEIGASVKAALAARPAQDKQRVDRIHSICARGQVAYAYVQSYSAATGQALPSPSEVVLARRTDAGWQAILSQSAVDYDGALAGMPETLLPHSAREALLQPLDVPASAVTFSGFYLPFPAGESAYRIRHWYPAIDFSIGADGGSGTIRNAKAGTVMFVKDSSTRQCGNPPPDWVCWMWANTIVIQSGPGEYAWYLHLAPNTIPDWLVEGAFAPAGADLGQEGATGWAAGPHVHFQISSTYSCCQGQGDYRMPDWPNSTTYPVDFNEYTWWNLPWEPVSANGSAVPEDQPPPGEASPPQDVPVPQEAPAAPPAADAPPLEPVGGVGAPAGGGVGLVCSSPYTVQPGDYMIRIAEKCGVKLSDLLAANSVVQPNLIYAGQALLLPGAPQAASTPPPEPAATVEPAATAPPEPAATVEPAPTAPPSASAACTGTYTVLPGDNVWRIATNCGLTVAQMAATNGLSSPYIIHAGEVLRYP